MLSLDPADTELNEAWPGPLQAMWWLKKGNLSLGAEWDKAHAICQAKEGDVGHDWVHALAHWIEGDDWNSGYWYRSAGKERMAEDVNGEWNLMADKLLAELGSES